MGEYALRAEILVEALANLINELKLAPLDRANGSFIAVPSNNPMLQPISHHRHADESWYPAS